MNLNTNGQSGEGKQISSTQTQFCPLTKPKRYFITVPFVIALFLAWTLIPSNVAGRTKRTLTSSFTFVGYCVGNMVGSQIFTANDAVRHIFPWPWISWLTVLATIHSRNNCLRRLFWMRIFLGPDLAHNSCSAQPEQRQATAGAGHFGGRESTAGQSSRRTRCHRLWKRIRKCNHAFLSTTWDWLHPSSATRCKAWKMTIGIENLGNRGLTVQKPFRDYLKVAVTPQ